MKKDLRKFLFSQVLIPAAVSQPRFLFSFYTLVSFSLICFYAPCFFLSRNAFNSEFFKSVINMCPGAWVMTIGGFARSTAA